jgi:hypothetical protein
MNENLNENLAPQAGAPAPTESFADRMARICQQLKTQGEPQPEATAAASAFNNWGNR